MYFTCLQEIVKSGFVLFVNPSKGQQRVKTQQLSVDKLHQPPFPLKSKPGFCAGACPNIAGALLRQP